MRTLLALLAFATFGPAELSAAGFSVKPLSCYEVSFRARVKEGNCIELSPQLAEMVPLCVSRNNVLGVRFCGVQWKFADASGRTVKRPELGASAQTLFSREWKTYRYRFWTPEKAERFDIWAVDGAKGNNGELADVKIREIPNPETLNFNGDFSEADDAAYGWQLVGSSRFENIAPGVSEVNTLDSSANSDLFLVEPGSSIRVEAVCSRHVLYGSRYKNINVRLEFYSTYEDASKGKRKSAYSPVKISPEGNRAMASHVYKVPEDKRWARVSLWHGIAHRIAVTKAAAGENK